MNDVAEIDFTIARRSDPVPDAERAKRLENPGFGTVFTDHMASIKWSEGSGWHSAEIGPRHSIEMDPASCVLHYAQEIFEGMKAYKLEDGGTALFRPDMNAKRFQDSAARLAMPQLPVPLFLEAVRGLTEIERDWIPPQDGGALYLRPFMFANEVFLGVRPAKEYLFLVIASAVGPYFKGGAAPVTIWVSEHFTRAAPGGTGAAKCGGNYAASLLPQSEAIEQGCDQVVFLDAVERRWVEELGGMNLFFVFEDGSVKTPPLTGTILPGITRDSIIRLMQDEGIAISEEPYAIDQWEEDAKSGKLVETFACGTAAVVTPVGTVKSKDGEFTIGGGGTGQTTQRMRDRLVGIQRGSIADPHGWVQRIG